MPDSEPPRLKSLPWNRWIGSVALAVILLSLLAICIPAILHLREAARRTVSRNCLKQLGLALHNYHDVHTVFPPGGVFDREGRGYHEWTTCIEPYQDASPWYNSVDFNIPWDDPRQVDLFRDFNGQQSRHFVNPSLGNLRRADGLVNNAYAANQRLMFRNSSVSLKKAGVSGQQLLVADAFGEFLPVGAPYGWRDVTLGLLTDPAGFGCRPRGMTQCLLVDGSVREIHGALDATQLAALAGTPEPLPTPEQVARPRAIPLIDTTKIWRWEWVRAREGKESELMKHSPGT